MFVVDLRLSGVFTRQNWGCQVKTPDRRSRICISL